MERKQKETVILVHGTWAAPDPATRRWYEPVDGPPHDESFAAKLDAKLQERGSAARCWAHCTERHSIFHWSGENSWIERTRAAAALGAYVAKLRKEGWCCHIVAHSHGGNVLFEALPSILAADPAAAHGRMVTLGTPFMDIRSPISRRSKRVITLFWGATVVLLLFTLLVFTLGFIATSQFDWLFAFVLIIGAFLFIALLPFLGRVFRVKNLDDASIGAQSPSLTYAPYEAPWRILHNLYKGGRALRSGEAAVATPRLLAISSRLDETWQLLHHMRTVANPLAVPMSLRHYLSATIRSRMAREAETEMIFGAKRFSELSRLAKVLPVLLYSVFVVTVLTAIPVLIVDYGWLATLGIAIAAILLMFIMTVLQRELGGHAFNQPGFAPFRWYGRLVGAVGGVPAAIVTYFVRRKAWPILLAMAMGLEGYRFELPGVDWQPNSEIVAITYEDMPVGAVQRALDRRSAWVAHHLGDVSQLFAKLAVTAADITSLLRTVEADQTLVHAAYYTEDACIARIADWIAGKE